MEYSDINIVFDDTKDIFVSFEDAPPLIGAKGDKGDTGTQGLQGIQGIQGIKGDKGDQGIQGVQGVQGIQGEKGDKGDKGEDGAGSSMTGSEIRTSLGVTTLSGSNTGDQDLSGLQLKITIVQGNVVIGGNSNTLVDSGMPLELLTLE